MRHERSHRVLLGTLLAGAVVAVYAQVGWHDFVAYDDPDYVTENAMVLRGLTLDGLRWAFTTGHMGHWHPLTWLSHMLDVQLFGLEPGPHHLVNVAFHLANSLLLFAFLARTTGATWPSFVVAALFGVHPLRVESVAWVAERKDVLSTFFWMLTMTSYVHWVRTPSRQGYAAILICLALGLMAKPMLVTLPFVLLLLDVWPLGRLGLPGSGQRSAAPHSAPRADRPTTLSLRTAVFEKAPLFAVVAFFAIVAYVTQLGSGAVAAVGELPLWLRLANAALSYVRYLAMASWPTNLAILYPYDVALPPWQGAAAALFLAGVTALALRAATRHPYALVGWLWYLGTLVPVIGIVQIGDQALADRYTYVPLIGIFIALAWLGRNWVVRREIPAPLVGVAIAVVIGAFSIATWRQLAHWQDGLALLSHTVQVTRANYVAHTNLGALLAARGRTADGIEQLQLALRYKPDYATAVHNLALALWQQGHHEDAVAQYRAALEIDPGAATTRSNLGLALVLLGKAEEAVAELETAVRLDPLNVRAHNNLGVALRATGRTDEALEHFEEASRIRPDYGDPYNNVGGILSARGDAEAAETNFRTALRLSPDSVEANFNLGRLLHAQDRPQEAIPYLNEAVRLDPTDPERRQVMAGVLLAAGRFADAIEHYRAVLEIEPNRPGLHFHLALALTESGRAADAIPHFEAALAKSPGDAQVHNDFGVALFTLGRSSEAREKFERALQIDPDLADARTNLDFLRTAPTQRDDR